ncbi:MAG: c-type cytochrome biogenesis protein CcmI [Beijerinckiaceae bacterium]
MTFWIAAAALMGLTCLALLAALGGGAAPEADTGHDRRFYEAQLCEIERQRSLGMMGEAEAEAARTEAARRLLAAAEAPAAAASGGGRKLAAIAVLLAVPAIALPVYVARGTPEMPGFALASRPKPKAEPGGQLDVAAAVQQIEAHLQKNPEDGRGHEVVAPVYQRMGRHADSVRSYGAALRILGATAERHANLGEALVYQAEGIVTAEAKTAFAEALKLDAAQVKARFFTALAAEQDGDRAKAVELLTGLQRDLPDGELKDGITQQLAALGAAPKGGEAIAALPRGEQAEAIRGMVEGLAQRLATQGGPASDWARLIRALNVLGEKDRASAILAEARQKFAGNADELRLIEDAAKATP